MRRADRLFQIIQFLRTRRVTTARWLAEELEVSERTIYRDVRDLLSSGVPIDGEAGIGYALRRGFDLPPLMFTEDEIAALTLGARIVDSWADPELARAAKSVLSKIETILPDGLRQHLDQTRLFSPLTRIPPETAACMAQLRDAIDNGYRARFRYTRADGATSQRTVWPLGLFFWGTTWTLGAWCELRGDFRNFRLDRVHELSLRGDTFPHTPGRTCIAYIVVVLAAHLPAHPWTHPARPDQQGKRLPMTDIIRCDWVPENDPLYIAYHDDEWGIPEYNDQRLFEMLLLEGAQAGLSWITILRKRENYRRAFDGFDAEKIACYGPEKIAALLDDAGIVRNRLKVNAAVGNARVFLEIQHELGSFSGYLWQFVDGKPIINKWKTLADVPASTAESDTMSKALKKRGFKFVGTTICYAFMQAVGMVNDHTTDCFRCRVGKG